MKKIFSIVFLFAINLNANYLIKNFEDEIIYVITDYGKEIYKKNIDIIHPIASLTKVMNTIVSFDAINEKKFSLKDKIVFDKYNSYISGGMLDTYPGDYSYFLEDLLMMQLIFSSNNSAYATAKYIGNGDINNFIKLMNEKAKSLNMNNTTFNSPAGLPPHLSKGYDIDISTARDLYKMTKESLKYDKIYEYSKLPYISFPYSSSPNRKYISRNKILGKYDVIGLKTGFHSKSNFNDIIVANMGFSKLIIITLNIASDKKRNKINLDFLKQLKEKEEIILEKGKVFNIYFDKRKYFKPSVKVNLNEQIKKFNFEKFDYKIINVYDDKKNLKKGDIIAKLEVYLDDKKIKDFDLVSLEENRKLNFMQKILRFFNFI